MLLCFIITTAVFLEWIIGETAVEKGRANPARTGDRGLGQGLPALVVGN